MYLNDDAADRAVAEDLTWQDIVSEGLVKTMQLSYLRNDDGTQINYETQCFNAYNMPNDATFLFVLEPAFYEANT